MCRRTLHNCFETIYFSRRTTLTRVERVNRTTCLVSVECALYRAALRTNDWRAPESVAVGSEVLFVPLGATLPRTLAAAWNVLWHCETTRADSEGNVAHVRVVPRRVGAHWSLAAITFVTDTGTALECAPAKTALVQVVDRNNQARDALVPLVPHAAIRQRLSQQTRHLAVVDLLANPTLLRTLLHSTVAVYMLPHLHDTSVHAVRDTAQRYEFLNLVSAAPKSQSFVVDAHTLGPQKCSLSAQQLDRLLRRSPNIVDASLLPVLTRERQTLSSFVAQTERRLAHNHTHRARANSANDSLHAQSQAPPLTSVHGACRTISGGGGGDISDDAIDSFAQRLLRLVDALAPSDAVGVLVRPYDLQSTALIEQECPYMLHNVGAFVPAVSRFCESL